MPKLPDEPHLRDWAERLESLGWAFLLVDRDRRLAYVSRELSGFFGSDDPATLGIGEHLAKAAISSPWLNKVPLEDQLRLLTEMAPFALRDEAERDRLASEIGDPYADVVRQLELKEMPDLLSTWFMWKDDDLPAYQVNMAGSPIRDEDGDFLGAWFVSVMGIRPSLVVLLARGNQEMYERMSKLVDPRRAQAAILFVDLQSSGSLSRQLPTATYFEFVRRFSTCVDENVAQGKGVVGKHAGDGASALFLTEHLGSSSAAAAAAIATARALVDMAPDLMPTATEDVPQITLNVGLHWGGNLYIGQLVPGGRLDVTALGDEMNECARIQETARNGTILASKSLLEQLDPDDAAAAGIELEKVSYRDLGSIEGAGEKAQRDAAGIPVTAL